MEATEVLTKPKDDLWAHQRQAVERAKELDYYALFFEPGTGKTATTIHMVRNKFNTHKQVLPTFILCPPVVVSNWKNEWAKFSKVSPDKIIPLVGTGKQRLALLQASDPNSIFITNFEALLMKDLFAEIKKIFYESSRSVLIVDEAHKVKDSTAKRTKLLMELAPLFKYRYILTGTPILNSLMDLYSQFKILDLGQRFGKNFFSFRATFFEDKNRHMPAQKHFPYWRPIHGAEDRIKRLIQDCSMFAEKSSCLDLPPLVRKVIEVPMGKEQTRLYESMKRDLIATVKGDDGRLRASIAELAITKALRLQQIVSGHLRVEGEEGEETKTLKIMDNPRKKALSELLEDLAPNHKVLVWAVFKDNYEDIRDVCRSLKIQYTELHGGVKDREGAIKSFDDDDSCRVLIGHPGSGGIGVNLVTASYSIFYSRSFSLEFDLQAEARNYRGGSERHVSITRIDLCCPGTIDELVMKSLASKQQLGDKILREHLEDL